MEDGQDRYRTGAVRTNMSTNRTAPGRADNVADPTAPSAERDSSSLGGTVDEFFDRIEPGLSAVEAYMVHRCPDPAHADDLIQEVLYRALAGRDRLIPHTDIRPWLMGIARNVLRKTWRRQGRGKRFQQTLLVRAIIDERERIFDAQRSLDRLEEMLRALRGCLEEVPEDARVLLTMRHVEDQTPTEIARELGCSPESVRTSIFRLKNGLRRCIERKMEGLSLA